MSAEASIARQVASDAARVLAANILRILAGAGDPILLLKQAVDLHRAHAHLGSQGNLNFSEDLRWRRDDDDSLDDIIDGSLRLVAARLLKQTTWESRSRGDLVDALRRLAP